MLSTIALKTNFADTCWAKFKRDGAKFTRDDARLTCDCAKFNPVFPKLLPVFAIVLFFSIINVIILVLINYALIYSTIFSDVEFLNFNCSRIRYLR